MSQPIHFVQGPNSYHSGDVKKMTDRLAQSQPGELVTYKELSTLIGRDVQDGKNRIALIKARQRALDEAKAFFIVEINQGLRRASNVEVSKSADRDFKSIRRKAVRVRTRLKTVDVHALNTEDRLMHLARAGLTELLAVEMRASSVKAIAESAKNINGNEIPKALVLAAFKK